MKYKIFVSETIARELIYKSRPRPRFSNLQLRKLRASTRGGLAIFSARAQFDQTSSQIVENTNQWAEYSEMQMSPCSHKLFLFRQPALRASARISRPASPPLASTVKSYLSTKIIALNYMQLFLSIHCFCCQLLSIK